MHHSRLSRRSSTSATTKISPLFIAHLIFRLQLYVPQIDSPKCLSPRSDLVQFNLVHSLYTIASNPHMILPIALPHHKVNFKRTFDRPPSDNSIAMI